MLNYNHTSEASDGMNMSEDASDSSSDSEGENLGMCPDCQLVCPELKS